MAHQAINEKDELLRLLHKLKHNTYELRSSITSLLLYIDSMETMDSEKRESSLKICAQINTKNNELIYSERLFEKVLDSFFDNKTPLKDN